MQPSTRLIVNADDYGHSSGVTAGIRRAHQHGIVTTATAMMCYDRVVDDIRLAREQCPRLGLGVHLMLTEGRPLRPARLVPSLTTSSGAFYDLDAFESEAGPLLFEQLNAAELRDEWRAQIEAFLAAGAPIDHLDSHHHIAYFCEKTFTVLLDLADAYHVPLRIPTEIALDGPPRALRFAQETPYYWLVERAAQLPIRRPDGFISSFYGEDASLAGLLALLDQLPEGVFELMCHPGYVDEQFCAMSSYNVERGLELAILVDPRVRELIERRGIELIAFAALT
jgi:predicted glycoside hydrolase/deacetylase ChbG (UPF0249 family)